ASLYEYSVTEDAVSSVVQSSKTTDEYYRFDRLKTSDGSSDTVVGETAEDRIASLHEVASDLENHDANTSSPLLSRSASIRSEIRSNGIESPAVSRSGSIKSTAPSRSGSIKSTALSRNASIKSTALSRSASIKSEAPAKDHEETTLSRNASIKSTTSSKRASIKAALLSHSASIKSEAQDEVINGDAGSVHEEKVLSRSASIKSTASSRRSSIKSTTNGGSTEAEFEERVKKNISKFKNEKSMTNVEVLKNLEKEEGEDQPSVKKLLAWAKGTRKAKTETMVVRQKKHEDKIRQAVDIGGVNLVLAEKETVLQGSILFHFIYRVTHKE
ncbi:uncharacterized protein LOC111707856, partial [Eurytemora carolleeae]|uniref:uncharacterized protein LOC111707856 n=1 Tax=Eurytemora carolleeae TaxID=1294199 RepID=UPI000C79382E